MIVMATVLPFKQAFSVRVRVGALCSFHIRLITSQFSSHSSTEE